MSQTTKKYWDMTVEELREATKEFDVESPPGTWKPASPKGKLLWDRARRTPATTIGPDAGDDLNGDPAGATTDEQRDAEVARFDRELDEAEFRPLTRKQRLLHEMAGVPIPKSKLTVEIDADIVMEARRLAELHEVSLDHFVEESIRGMVAFTEPH